MCGIAGIWNTNGARITEGAALGMQQSLMHRGPDSSGIYEGEGVALVHTRLSIIDLTDNGAQPFISEDSRYVLVFNGEIYNYQELREQFFHDQVFRSESDTEVLLYMLVRFGASAFQYLRGMFAVAFYDTQEKKMIVARDAFGKKPLYYYQSGDIFIFASEPKAILASAYVSAQLDASVVAPYFLHEYCPFPKSGFEGIVSVGAGHYMEITQAGTHSSAWWKPEILPKHHVSFKQALSTFDELLGNAVARRMVADVPVGLFLSGGLDSSTIAWYMRRIKTSGEIHSCSVAFDDNTFNEEHIASQVAHDADLTHHRILFTKDSFLQSVDELIPLLDIPFADSSLLPTYAVSKLARQYMKVVLDGDGSDELLGGYGTFNAHEVAHKLSWIPSDAWGAIGQGVDTVFSVSHSYFSLDFKIKSFLRGVSYPAMRNLQVWLGAFTEHEISELLIKKDDARNVFEFVDSIQYPATADNFEKASLYHIASYLSEDILVKLDRATMAVGLEARTPFLDTDVAEFLLRLPSSYKKNKRILRELMRGRLPDIVVTRKKQGFGIPISSWFAHGLLPFVERVLSPEAVAEVGLFNYQYIRIIIDEHRSMKHDHRKKIWSLIAFQLWYEYWILEKKRA